ncbi:hypothetical protein FACS189426_20850 [Bacteroidia bacterium]|nr:hypothetical protein FACS189426_20850 [Bacteroidia bacterium]
MENSLALAEFARLTRDKTDEVNGASGKKAVELQTALSRFIGEQTRLLIARGLSVAEIQDALRAAADAVPQTYAPNAAEPESDSGGALEPPISETVYFLPMEESVIAAFAAGELDSAGLMGSICVSPDVTPLELTEGLALVLTDFGRQPKFEEATGGGEIVAGPDGEAFIPERLSVTEPEAGERLICEPMVFKAADEVRALAALLMPVDEKTFRKRVNVRKLLKFGWPHGYGKHPVKEEADYIIAALLAEFAMLRTSYLKAAAHGKGMAVFVGYQGEATDGPL